MMVYLSQRTWLALWWCFSCVLYTTTVTAQSGGGDGIDGNESCGEDITAHYNYFEIKFLSFCKTRLTNGGNSPPEQRASFRDCSAACVNQGITCGGFAYDRSSHFGTENCYLIQAPIAAWQSSTNQDENVWYDSAIVDNSSLPITRRDCETSGTDGVYNDMVLKCGMGVQDSVGGYQDQIDSMFASSITDCIDHCRNFKVTSSGIRCEAVAWDPFLVHGYQNCILKSQYYVEPVTDVGWDSATLVGTTGRVIPRESTTLSASGPTSVSSTMSSTSSSMTSPTSSQSAGSTASPRQTSPGTAIGVGVGVGAAVLIAGCVALYFWLRRRKARKLQASRGLNVPDLVHTKPDEPVALSDMKVGETGDTSSSVKPPAYSEHDVGQTVKATKV